MPFTTRPLDPTTWEAFAELVERNNGVFGANRPKPATPATTAPTAAKPCPTSSNKPADPPASPKAGHSSALNAEATGEWPRRCARLTPDEPPDSAGPFAPVAARFTIRGSRSGDYRNAVYELRGIRGAPRPATDLHRAIAASRSKSRIGGIGPWPKERRNRGQHGDESCVTYAAEGPLCPSAGARGGMARALHERDGAAVDSDFHPHLVKRVSANALFTEGEDGSDVQCEGRGIQVPKPCRQGRSALPLPVVAAVHTCRVSADAARPERYRWRRTAGLPQPPRERDSSVRESRPPGLSRPDNPGISGRL